MVAMNVYCCIIWPYSSPSPCWMRCTLPCSSLKPSIYDPDDSFDRSIVSFDALPVIKSGKSSVLLCILSLPCDCSLDICFLSPCWSRLPRTLRHEALGCDDCEPFSKVMWTCQADTVRVHVRSVVPRKRCHHRSTPNPSPYRLSCPG